MKSQPKRNMRKNLKILFVDDEQNILDGLRRGLRPIRGIWDMAFALSGDEALRLMEEQARDVVVSDIRMPGMDGFALLTEVKERWPKTVRVTLSGFTEMETLLSSLGLAHAFLSKPCDTDALVSTIDKSCRLRGALAGENLVELVNGLSVIPSAPKIFYEIVNELESPGSSALKVAEIISQDTGMTAKLLQLVNSAFFGIPRHITTPAQAVAMLGFDIVKALVLSAHIFSAFKSVPSRNFSIEKFHDHCFLTALFAKEIVSAETGDKKISDKAFLVGILHDIGFLIMAANMPEHVERILERHGKEGIAIHEAEMEEYNHTHAEIGAYLLGLWGFPDDILWAVNYHHTPWDTDNGGFSLTAAIYAANVLADMLDFNMSDVKTERFNMDYLESLGVANRLDMWMGLCRKIASRNDSNGE